MPIRKNKKQQTTKRTVRCETLESKKLFASLAGTEFAAADVPAQVSSVTPIASAAPSASGEISISFYNGNLLIRGTNNPALKDVVNVSEQPGGLLRVGMYKYTAEGNLLGERVRFVAKSAVTSELRFVGYAGDDTFSNSTDLPSRVWGGDGNDIIFGGSGNDFLRGEEGNDFILGGAGDDTILGSIWQRLHQWPSWQRPNLWKPRLRSTVRKLRQRQHQRRTTQRLH